ncbi:MAG: DUF167 domain-containing protein [Planctomycetota bacterium]|jgi:uncharacterized protein (TIGR00251 family)
MSAESYRVDERGGAVVVDVHAVPGSKRGRIAGVHGGALKVHVPAPAEKGRANAALVELMAGAAGVARSAVEIVSGRSSRRKRVRIEGVTAAALRARIGPFPG